jgi:hypothetical protein
MAEVGGSSMSKTYREYYPTIGSILDRLDMERPSDSGDSSTETKGKESWDLGLGWKGTLDCYAGGWSEGAKRAYDLAETLDVMPTTPRPKLVKSVVGGHPNVGAYLAGNPVNMYNVSKRAAQGQPFVHFYMHISYNASVNANTAFDRGCALVALADALETAGCRVKVTALELSSIRGGKSGKSGTDRYVAYHELKDYSDRLDVDNLIFTAAHPAYFRRIGFALRERCDDKNVRANTNNRYGNFCEVVPEDLDNDGSHNILLSGLDGNGGTPESFLADMVKQLPETVKEWIGE